MLWVVAVHRRRSLRMRCPTPAALFPLVIVLACDNVGRVFDPGGGPGGGGAASGIQAVSAGGNTVDGRPRVVSALPTGPGWPATVPVVVVFNESVSRSSVNPGTGEPATLFVRAAGTTTAVPAEYDFLLGDQVVVIRPVMGLTSSFGPPDFEVVISPDLTDIDGVRLGGSADMVIASFTANEATGGSSQGSVNDGRILAVLPDDDARDVPLESPVFAIFTKPPDAASVTPQSFRVTQAGVPVPGTLDFPVGLVPGGDRRVLRFLPNAPFAASTAFAIEVDETITFGMGRLDFGNRRPFSRFRTGAFSAPLAVRVGNAATGFPDQINLGNLATLRLDVDVDATAAAGDVLVVRCYGLDRQTGAMNDLGFVERTATAPMAGVQTVSVDFSGALGTTADPLFEDGEVLLAAQLRRGAARTGYIRSSTETEPRLDVTPPSLVAIGPPGGPVAGDLVTDLERVAVYGTASERLAAATLTALGQSVEIFGSDDDGHFVMRPLDAQLMTEPFAYQLTLTDAAGNLAPMTNDGRIVPRGVVSGSVAGGTLVVEAYDESTFAPVVGAVAVVQPDPASTALRAVGSTGADGRATFTSLTEPRYTVTLIAPGYHVRTLHDTGAGFASLPLRPLADRSATVSGMAMVPAGTSGTLLVGHNLIDDVTEEDIPTLSTSRLVIPPTAIRPNRVPVVTAFAGPFEPTAQPAFLAAACEMCGLDARTPTAPSPPAEPAGASLLSLQLTPPGFAIPTTPFALDFAAATGLGMPAAVPTVRVVAGLSGFSGMTLLGVGFATSTGGAAYNVQGTLWTGAATTLLPFTPAMFLSTEARDASGNISRHRIALDAAGGTTPLFGPPGIPVIATPGGPFVGAPLVTYSDPLDTSAVSGSFAFVEITATDVTGRTWSVLRQDLDGVNSAAQIQFPDLTGVAPGLQPGAWSVRAETHATVSSTFAADTFVLEEVRRQQVGYARAQAVPFVVN